MEPIVIARLPETVFSATVMRRLSQNLFNRYNGKFNFCVRNTYTEDKQEVIDLGVTGKRISRIEVLELRMYCNGFIDAYKSM